MNPENLDPETAVRLIYAVLALGGGALLICLFLFFVTALGSRRDDIMESWKRDQRSAGDEEYKRQKEKDGK